MITFMNAFALFVGAVAIEACATPSEIWDFWIGYFKNIWWFIKEGIKLLFRKKK